MGRDGGKIQCPRGITIREHAHAQRVIVAFTFQGIECREVTGLPATPAGIKVAANLRGEIIRKIENGVFVYSDYFPNGSKLSLFGRPATKITVGDLLDKQTSAYQAALHNGAIKRSTYNGYIKDIHRLRNDWQNVLVSDATPTKLKNWISLLGRSRKGITNLLTPLHSAFEDALNDGLIEFDPFSRISLKKLLRDYAKRSVAPDMLPFDAMERAAISAKAAPEERDLLEFWFATGLRPGELMALEWGHIDFVHKTAKIILNLVDKEETDPKTAAGLRDVDLSDVALKALASQKPRSFLAGGKVWLHTKTGQPWAHHQQLRRSLWEPLLKRAGVLYRRPYNIRHTYASALLTQGQNPWYVGQQLGHNDVECVYRMYGKFIRQDYLKPRLVAVQT